MFTYGREKARLSGGAVAQYAVSVVLLMSAMLIYIYPSIRSTSLMYEYSRKFNELTELRELEKKVRLELSTLRSYDFIEKKAVEELGFVQPSPGQVVIIAKK